MGTNTLTMADSDTNSNPHAVVEVEEVNDLGSAVRRVCKNCLAVDGLARGLHEGVKSIEAGKAQFAFLAESCDEPNYKKLVRAMCAEKSVPIYDIPDNKSLGEWSGLCKIDCDGKARKIVGASLVVVMDHGEDSDGLTWLRNNSA